MPPCRTSRLLLRGYRPSDRAEFLQRLAESRELLDKHLPLHRPGESDADVFERHLEESSAPNGVCWRLGVQNEDGVLVGGVSLVNIRRGLTFEADANWWIAPAFQRRGYATEAVQALIDVALGDAPRGLGLHRVNALIRPCNQPSLRLARRLGFRRDPRTIASVLLLGEPVAHHLYTRDCA